MNKPKPIDLETERHAVAEQDLKAYCDLVVSRAAELMAEQNAPFEMIIDRLITYTAAQCLVTFGKDDALLMLNQAIKTVESGALDHLQKPVN